MQHDPQTCQASQTTAPVGGGQWTWWAWCLWLPACVGFAALLAWASLEIGRHFSPLLVFPLLIGLVLGASLVALMRLGQMGHRPTAWLAVLLSVAAVVVGQHYFGYRSALARIKREDPIVRRARQVFGDLVQGDLAPGPRNLADYLQQRAAQGRTLRTVFGTCTARGPWAWSSWAIDGLLVLLPAVVMMGFALRRPFCGRCGSWYATRRRGRLPSEAARRLAEELQLPAENVTGGAWYRLICCNQGCTPTGFSLSCKKPVAAHSPEIVWLDDRRRDRVIKILDQSRGPQ